MVDAVDMDALYAASYRRLVVQLYALCGDLADAEDAVQEAFVAALRKQRAVAAVANPEAWLRTVAVNRIRGGWRHLAVVRRYAVKVPAPRAAVEVGPEHVAVVRALDRLDEPQRLVVVLHYLADLGVEEIAAELGIPVGTVKSRLARARGRLADLLDEHVDEREEPRHA
jgi:RNA polymerase sigma-70 factor, ECF subfamily